MNAENRQILVIGGGISGLTAALEAAETGAQVILTEKAPYLGGRVAQLHRYFPKLCPPTCGLEINFRRLRENPRITFYTQAEVTQISGSAGNFDVAVEVKPRYVNDRCVACHACAEACPKERVNDFNYGLDKTKAAFLPYDMAFPLKYVIDAAACNVAGDCGKKCLEACTYEAIDLGMQSETLNLQVGSIIVAGGWELYDIARADLCTTRSVRKRLDLDRAVEPERIERCIAISLQAPTGSNTQGGRVMVITDPAKRRVIADAYREGFKIYQELGLALAYEAGDLRSRQCERILSSSTYLVENLHRVPVHVIYCVQGRVEEMGSVAQASSYGSVLPAAWSFMLAAARGKALGRLEVVSFIVSNGQQHRLCDAVGDPESFGDLLLVE